MVGMIKNKSGIRLLRHLGTVLIFLPEVFTTPLGVALILAAQYLSRRIEAALNMRLRETLKSYLVHSKCFDDSDDKSETPSRVRSYSQAEERLILYHYKGSRVFDDSPVPSIWQNRCDIGDDVIHHTLDMKALSRRYKTGESIEIKSDWFDSSAKEAIHHTINMESLSRRYKDDTEVDCSKWTQISDTEKEVTHHSIDKRLLSMRYKDDIGANSNFVQASDTATEVIHHSVDMKVLSQNYETDRVAVVEARCHTVNMASLLRRYQWAVVSLPALKAC